jgi:hypothetical protein
MTAPGLSATAAFALALADIGPLMTEIIKAQAESNLQLQQSVQTNMFGNIRATLTTLAAMGSSKESKLLDSKLRTLQAWARRLIEFCFIQLLCQTRQKWDDIE